LLGSDCDTALYANLTEDATRAVCIGVNGSSTSSTSTSSLPSTSATKTTSTFSTTTTSTMGPTATGTVARCQQFYTVPSGGPVPQLRLCLILLLLNSTPGIQVVSFHSPPLCFIFPPYSPASRQSNSYLFRRANVAIVGSDCTLLLVGYAYCVQGPPTTTITSGPTDPTQTGIASNCNE